MAGRHSAAGGPVQEPPRPSGGRHSRPHTGSRPVRGVVVALMTVLLVGAGIGYYLHRQHNSRDVAASASAYPTAASSGTPTCTGQLAVPVVVSPELAATVTKLVTDWRATNPTIGGRCVSATVTPQQPARAAASLAGVRTPVVWIPDSSVWSGTLAAARRAQVRPEGSIATSPLVVAGAPAAVTALRREAAKGWAGILSGPVPVRLTDPDTTSSGALVTLAAAAATGTSQQAQTTLVALYMRLQSSIAPSTSTAFAALRSTKSPPAAFVTSERDVIADNAGNAQRDSAPLHAVYPTGPTPMLDYPLVQVRPTGAAASAVSAAEAVGKLLRTATARTAFAAIGLRDAKAGPVSGRPAVHPAGAPPATAQQTAARLWRAADKPSQLLAVIDVSGSMNDPAKRGAAKKITVAADAAGQALRLLPDDWRIGLWTFSTHKAPKTDWTELAAIAPVRGHRSALVAAAATLPKHVGGNTALYSTALGAFTEASARYDPGAVNVVVLLTDGSNVDPNGNLGRAKLLGELSSRYDPHRPVHIVTIAFGRDADVGVLRQISAVTHGQSYQVGDAAQIRSVIVASIIANNP